MENADLIAVVSQFKALYVTLGVLTVGASFGGAWALIRFGIGRNAENITRLDGDVDNLYERTNDHNAELSRLDERSLAINSKLDLIHNEIKKGK